jgi:hypothetical protein
MSGLLQDDKGNISSTRIGYFIKLGVGVVTLFYCIFQKWLPWEMVAVLCGLLGLNEMTKLIGKKLEK